MREFRIKVNNEKTYVVKANDYNQAVKTLHSKLRDFDDTKKNINVVREFITNNGGKFSKSKDADAILDFIYKKTGVKNADYGDVLYIIRNYTNVKVEDNAVSDSISKYNGEDAIRTNGFVKIKEDGDWTSYKYNGSDFDNAVFKIHQYNPSLIAFISNGNRTITVRNKYLKDSSITDTDMKTAEDIIKKYGGNPVGNVMGLQKTRFVGQDEIKNQHDFATDLDKAGYKFYLINGRYRISPKDSSIKDVSYVSGKNLKIGQKIVEDGEVLEVVDIKETQRGVNNNYRDVTFKNVKTGATETVHFGNSTLARLNDYSPKYNKGQKIQTSAGVHEIIGYDPVRADVHTNRIEYSYRLKTPNGTYTNIPDWQLEELVKLGRYKLIDSSIQDADPVKVEKIIRKEKSALGITYYIFQTKSSSGYTIYYQVTDKTYHGEPTYSGGGIISLSLKSANDTLDHNLLADKLKAKYGEKEGTKRYLRGENDSAIKDSNIKDAGFDAEYAEHQRKLDAEVRRAKELHKVNGALDYTTLFKQVFNYTSRGDRLTQLTKTVGDYTYVIYLNNNRILYCVWDKSGNIPKGWCPTVTMYDEYTIKDSNNIKNRKSYTIKVGDKQYKVFAESESEAINKYIKSKKQ